MELVRLATAPNEVEAQQIRALLKLEGIESMQRITDTAFGDQTGMGGSREILVRSEHLELARTLMQGDNGRG